MKKKTSLLAKAFACTLAAIMAWGGLLACSHGGGSVDVSKVSIKYSATGVYVGDNITLTAVVEPEDADYDESSIKWTSSDQTVLSISENGRVVMANARNEGYADVYVTVGGVRSGTQTFHVYDGNTKIPEGEREPGTTNPDDSENDDTNGSTSDNDNETQGPGSSQGPAIQKPTATLPQGTSIEVVENDGWLNSAYVVFKQVADGITYKVTVDGEEIDKELIRYYDTYTAYTPNENDSTLAVTYDKKTYSKVVRADALGLRAGGHEIAIYAVGTDGESDPTTFTASVSDHDRSGFAFTGDTTPGAYKADGTLKDGAIVIYLTQANKKTVKATISGKEYTGIQDITQQIKNSKVPVDIRIVGTVKAENNDLSSDDHKSSYALGVKEASEVTIEGVGHDATLYGAGVAAFSCSYIEIANLGLMKWGGGKDGDGIALKGGGGKGKGYIWVHNNDVFYGDAGSDGDQVKGDGSMDLKDDTKYVTIAYNHFWDSGKMSLCGMKSESGPNYITYHHNWFDHSDSRHPRIRTMTVHIYNNYFDGNAKYGVGVTTGASAFVEGNYFRNAHNPMLSSKQGTDALGAGTFSGEKGGVIKSYNNEFAQKNENGVKFQFLTNKYDYTSNKALGAYREWYEDVGKPNGDGTYTIYDSKITSSSSDTIATNSLIAIEDASVKGAYYQVSKNKTAFFIDVPRNTTKIVINAKTGSSTSGATSGINIKDENDRTIASVSNIGNSTYQDFTFNISGLSADSTLEIANSSGSNSLNITGIKVIAASAWNTKLTEGADPTNIDAYEVDSRSDKVPDNVKTRSGGTTYSNFDTTMGNSGLGLSKAPTEPGQAKKDVLTYSGRHNSDFAHPFNNAVDDASYAKNDALNNALLAYRTGLTATQGKGETASGGSSSGSTGGNTGSDSGNTGGNTGGGSETVTLTDADYPTTPLVAGTYENNFSSIGFKLVKASSSLSSIATKQIDVYYGDYLTFYVDKACTFNITVVGNKGCKLVKSDGTIIKDMGTPTGALGAQSLTPGRYYITSGGGTNPGQYTRLKPNIVVTY